MKTHNPIKDNNHKVAKKTSTPRKPHHGRSIQSFWKKWRTPGGFITFFVLTTATLYLQDRTQLYIPIWIFYVQTGLCISAILIWKWFKNQMNFIQFILYCIIGFCVSFLLFIALSTIYLGINCISNDSPTYIRKGIIVKKRKERHYYLYLYYTDSHRLEKHHTKYTVFKDCIVGDTLQITLRQGLLGHPVITDQRVLRSFPHDTFELPYHIDLKPKHIRTDP